jgi:hypothetical protein
MYINDILSMPDKWEYPWFATYVTRIVSCKAPLMAQLGHCIPLSPSCHGRPFVRQETTRLDDSRMVHEARRSFASL